jgi:phospholipid/cholesterol/gamma-HCH transport system substrate-binding protein
MSRNSALVVSTTKFAIFTVVAVLVTLSVATTIRPFGTTGKLVRAEFASASRLAAGDQVRVAGVVSGQVQDVEVTSEATAIVTLQVDADLELTEGTGATIKYLNLVGDRYVSLTPGDGARLAAGEKISLSHTQPALDLNVLFNGFKPLFAAMSPGDVNGLAEDIVQTFQGEGPTVTQLLDHTASLTQNIANREEVIGRLLGNLNEVLGLLDQRHARLDQLVVELRSFVTGLSRDRFVIGRSVAHIDELTAETAGLLRDIRPGLAEDIRRVRTIAETLNRPTNRRLVEHALEHTPVKLGRIIRTASYGSWFNYYFCDLRVRITENTPSEEFIGMLGGRVITVSAHDSARRCNQ